MQKPVILTVDDDLDVLRAIERDLKRHYEERYRVLRAESGKGALDLLHRLQQRNDAVALMVVDHRMPQMNGVEMLKEAIKLYPEAKRTLLTAYADTDAAIKAVINEVQLHHYLLKPWDPPEQQLYPVLDDLLEDWYAGFHPPFGGIRVLGTRWSSKSYEIRSFLASAIRSPINGSMPTPPIGTRWEVDRLVRERSAEGISSCRWSCSPMATACPNPGRRNSRKDSV